jgi:type IV conjugative transfer system lipoprotein TraV
MKSVHFLLFAGLLVSGCGANTSSDFLCPAQIGSPCATISEADHSNRADVVLVAQSDAQRAMGQLAQASLGASGATGPFASMPDGGQAGQGGQFRTPEVVARAWIAPYLDAGGILHESQYIYFVMAESRWIARP